MEYFFRRNLIIYCLFFFLGVSSLYSSDVNSNLISGINETYSTDSLLNQLLNKAINSAKSGNFELSEMSFQQAINLIDTTSGYAPLLAYRIYVNFGIFNRRIGRLKEALKYYNFAEKIVLTNFGEDCDKLGPVYLNQGNIYNQLINPLKAEKYYNKALYFFKRAKNKNEQRLAILNNNLGIIYKQKGDYSKALEFLFENLAIKKRLNYGSLDLVYINIANCYSKLKDFSKASYYYSLCISEAKRMYGADYFHLGDYYMNFAISLFDYSKHKEAFQYIKKAHSIYYSNFGIEHPDMALCLKNYGDFNYKTGKYRKALEYYQKALNSELENFQDSSFYSNPDLHHLEPQNSTLGILKHKAYAFFDYYRKNTLDLEDLKFSLQTYDLCLELINRIRIGYQDEESRLSLSQNEKDTYIQAIEIAWMLYDKTGDYSYKEKALHYAERSKAASLMASLQDVTAKEFGGIPVALLEKEQEIRKDIAKYRAAVYEERKKLYPEREKITQWQNELFNLNSRYEEMVNIFETEYPDYYALRYDSGTIEVDELQKLLREDELLVEYSLSDSALFTFVVSKNDIQVQRKVINKKVLDQDIEMVRNSLKTNDFSSNSFGYYKNYIRSAHQLYKELIEPIDSLNRKESYELKGQDSIVRKNKLIIVPDDKLAYLPFGILLQQEADSSSINYRHLDYLLKDYTITYHNSATLGFKVKSQKHRSSKMLLAFAPMYEHVNDSILYVERSVYRDKLFPLPGVKEEVNNISEVIDGDLFVDELATEANFKKNAKDYDVLHLAMHTIIDDENPMFSKLVFTQNEDDMEDGLLNTHEIYNMNFNARMVVLSACNTGDGKLFKGEGVMSLARGFFYAGCPSIIMTLWTVEDKSGSSLMTYFYQYLAKGMAKDEALRAAKLEYLSKADPLKAHPYFWSGYVTLGDTSAMYPDSSLSKTGYLAILLLLGVPFYYMYRRKKLKN